MNVPMPSDLRQKLAAPPVERPLRRDDPDCRHAQNPLDFLGTLDIGVEVFEDERKADAADKPDHAAEQEVERLRRPRRRERHLRPAARGKSRRQIGMRHEPPLSVDDATACSTSSSAAIRVRSSNRCDQPRTARARSACVLLGEWTGRP